MSFIRRALEGRASVGPSDPPSSPAATALFGITESPSGVEVTHGTSLTLSAVWAAINLLARSVATLPLNVYRRLPNGGREVAYDHPLHPVLHTQANADQTSFEWRQMAQAHLGLRGNAYHQIRLAGSGAIAELVPLHPDRVRLERRNLKLFYFYRPDQGEEEPIPANRIMHLRGLATNGLIGLDPIAAARRSLGIAVASEEYSARVFKNSARPDGILKHPKTLSDEARKRLEAGWGARHSGALNAGKTAVLEEGLEWQAIGLSPENSQMLATRKFSTTQVAQWFGVPPHMIGDLERATFSNIEQQVIDYVVFSLSPWLQAWEQRMTASLLMPSEREEYFIAFVVEGLLRGDSAARAAFYTALFNVGAITPNEMRALENMNPVENGDQVMLPLNMLPASVAADYYQRLLEEPRFSAPASAPSSGTRAGAPEREARAGRAESVEWRAVARVAQAFEPSFVSAIEKVIRGEQRTGNRQAEKLVPRAGAVAFAEWLTKYYGEEGDFRAFASETLRPVVRALIAAVDDRAASEVDVDPIDSELLDESARSYAAAFATNHAAKSERIMLRAVEDAERDGGDVLETVSALFATWLLERPAREAARESIRTSRGSQRQAYDRAGRGARWVTMGQTCPYCRSLNGKIVGSGANFAGPGDALGGESGEPLRVTRSVFAPPVHGGCDCQIAPA